jgi:hypothetical protein
MLLSDYEWSRNPRGMHNSDVFSYNLDFGMYQRTRMGWVKLVVAGPELIRLLPQFYDLNITPIVRLYMPRVGADPMTRERAAVYEAYAREGVKWFEFYNEPNLGIEWPFGVEPDWRNARQIAALCENWLTWAEFIISMGCYPGFIALAESAERGVGAVQWMDAMLNYLAANQYDRFLNVLRGGAYCATHPYILNHFYQEVPGGGPLSARPPRTQNGEEGGWHFEYPYDPISQADDPGRTVYGGTRLTPFGDPTGLTAMGRMFNERCARLFGTQAIPVVGTEGGIWDWPAPGEGFLQQDDRFPPYDNRSQAEATVAMFTWIAAQAPRWFFGLTLWKEDIYLDKGGQALSRLTDVPQRPFDVPDIPVMSDGSVPVFTDNLRGPGPILGQADFHMVLLDNQLDPDFFFRTAQDYWDEFRPIVTTTVEFFELMPYEKSLAVTLLVTAERQFDAEQLIRENYPNTYLDSIVIDEEEGLERLAQIFALRVDRGLRFG